MTSSARYAFRQVAVSFRIEVADPSGTTFLTTHCYVLEALIEARFFERRYTWTGGGVEKQPTVESGRDDLGHARHRLHGPVIYEEEQRILLVDLGRDFAPGDREAVEIKQTFIDTFGTFQPFLGRSVPSVPQLVPETLVLELQLHKTLTRDVRREVRRVGASTPSKSEALPGQDGLYVWKVPKIEPDHNYRIDWSRYQR